MTKRIDQLTTNPSPAITDVVPTANNSNVTYKNTWQVIADLFATLSQTLTNKTLTAPTIADFTNAAHDHGDADDGGAVVSASTTVAGVQENATDAEAITGSGTGLTITPANLRAVLATMPDGTMFNLVITPTVSANDLIVTMKTKAGTDPSATDPGWVKINGTVRTVTGALSITIADGTSWFNSGSAELGTKLVPYFVYLLYDSNSSAVALTIARKPFYRVVAAAMATTTDDNHIFGYSGFTAGDDMVNVGYFEATLSLTGTGHLWTVPTFTSENLRNEPTFETRMFTYAPTWVNLTTTTGTESYQYCIKNRSIHLANEFTFGASSAVGGSVTHTLPMNRGATYGGAVNAPSFLVRLLDASSSPAYAGLGVVLTTSIVTLVAQDDTTYLRQALMSSTIPFTWTTSDQIIEHFDYLIM